MIPALIAEPRLGSSAAECGSTKADECSVVKMIARRCGTNCSF
jgi:hypothetical protein